MPFFRKAAQLAAIVAALAVAAFVFVTALKKPTPSAVPDVKADPTREVFSDGKPKAPAPTAPTPSPKVFGITPGKRSPLGEGGPLNDPRP